MTGGEGLAEILLRMAWLGHSALGRWVDVTNATEGEGAMRFTVLPAGSVISQWAGSTLEAYASIVAQLGHVPRLVDSMLTLLLSLVS